MDRTTVDGRHPAGFDVPLLFDAGGDRDGAERAIPIRPADLVRSLLGESDLSPGDRSGFSQFAKILGSIFHYEFYGWLCELKDYYSPLDPDSDCATLKHASRSLTDDADERFLGPFEAALIRANYRPLSFETLQQAVSAPNELGLTYVPDFNIFEHLKVYVRGKATIRRTFRTFKTRFRKREILLPGHSRMVVILKFRKGLKLDQYARGDVLYLRLFKDVPHVDMEMHLPEQGTKVRMRIIDKAQIASPLMAVPATLAAKVLAATFIGMTMPSLALGSLVAAPVTASVNSFFGFQRAKQKHLAHMIRHLYYLTLANNESVINRLVDSAEEEEFKEALLGYYFLWKHRDDPEPWDSARLDRAVEAYIGRETGLAVDFEVSDALKKLVRLGVVRVDPQEKLSAVPLDQALAILDEQWDHYFRFHRDGPGHPSPSRPTLDSTKI